MRVFELDLPQTTRKLQEGSRSRMLGSLPGDVPYQFQLISPRRVLPRPWTGPGTMRTAKTLFIWKGRFDASNALRLQ